MLLYYLLPSRCINGSTSDVTVRGAPFFFTVVKEFEIRKDKRSNNIKYQQYLVHYRIIRNIHIVKVDLSSYLSRIARKSGRHYALALNLLFAVQHTVPEAEAWER